MGGWGRRQPKGLHTASWGHASTAMCGLTAPPRDAPAVCGLTAPPWDCAARRWSTLQNNGRTGRPGAGIPRGGGGGGSRRRPPVRSGASGSCCRGGSDSHGGRRRRVRSTASHSKGGGAAPAAVVVSALAPPAPRAPALAAPGAGSAAPTGAAVPPTWDWHPTSSREGHASPVRCLTLGLDCPASHTPMRCLTAGLEGHASPSGPCLAMPPSWAWHPWGRQGCMHGSSPELRCSLRGAAPC